MGVTSKLIIIITLAIISVNSWKPFFIGHRGGFTGVENTVESYRNGVDKYGFQALECDVRVTKDGVFVINHNSSLIGSKGKMVIEKSTLAQLKSNKLTQVRGGIEYHGVICTMEEYLQICVEKNAVPYIELKATTGINGTDMHNFDDLLNLVKKYKLEKKVVFFSFMEKSLEYIIKNYPELKLLYSVKALDDTKFNWCVKNRVNPNINSLEVNMENTEKLHNEGIFTAIWCVNEQSDYVKYGNMGVYAMMSDSLMVKDTIELKKRWPDLNSTENMINRNTVFRPLEEWEKLEAERMMKEEIEEINEYERNNKNLNILY